MLTELNSSDGSLVQTISGRTKYGFDGLSHLTFAGSSLWATDNTGNSVTELNGANGSLQRVVSGVPTDSMGRTA